MRLFNISGDKAAIAWFKSPPTLINTSTKCWSSIPPKLNLLFKNPHILENLWC